MLCAYVRMYVQVLCMGAVYAAHVGAPRHPYPGGVARLEGRKDGRMRLCCNSFGCKKYWEKKTRNLVLT